MKTYEIVIKTKNAITEYYASCVNMYEAFLTAKAIQRMLKYKEKLKSEIIRIELK